MVSNSSEKQQQTINNKRQTIFLILLVLAVYPATAQSFDPDTLIAYKSVEGVELNIHVFFSDTPAENAPAMVYYFGGGFVGGTPAQFYPHAEHFTKLGMVVFGVEYRIRNEHGTTPFESVEDAMSSMRWVRVHAEEFGIDPDRIVAAGGSAGGHLAAATAMLKKYDAAGEDLSISRAPNALVLFNPVIDNGPEGYGYERIGERYIDFSPYHNIDDAAPPTIVFLGTDDNLIPVETMVRFQEALQMEGVRCDIHLYGGQPHGFFNYRQGTNPYYDETVAAAEEFLRSLGFIGE